MFGPSNGSALVFLRHGVQLAPVLRTEVSLVLAARVLGAGVLACFRLPLYRGIRNC